MATATGATRPLGFSPEPKSTSGKKKKRAAAPRTVTERVAHRAVQEMQDEAPPQVIKRKRKHPPAGENSRDKFIRLATARVETALYSIRLLGNLANRHVYRYEDGDVDVIRKTLIVAIDEALSQFTKKERPEIKLVFPVSKKS